MRIKTVLNGLVQTCNISTSISIRNFIVKGRAEETCMSLFHLAAHLVLLCIFHCYLNLFCLCLCLCLSHNYERGIMNNNMDLRV